MYKQSKLFCSGASLFSLKVSRLRGDGSCRLECLWGEAHNEANNSVSIMITAPLHTLDTISFPAEVAVSGVWRCSVCFSIRRKTRKLRHDYLRLSKQPTDAWGPSCLWLRDDKVRWRCERRGKKFAGCHVAPEVETKPKGCCLNPVHAHWAEYLAPRPSAVHHQDGELAADRVWFRQMDGQTRVVCCPRRSDSSVKLYRRLWNHNSGPSPLSAGWLKMQAATLRV